MRKQIAAALVGLMTVSAAGTFSVSAAELHFSGSINTDGVVSVSGYGNPGYVSVEIIRGKEDAVLESYENREITDSVLTDAAAVGEDGAFSFQWRLPSEEDNLPAEERYYTAVIGNTDNYISPQERALTLYYAKDSEITDALALVKQAIGNGESKNLKSILEENADVLQINGLLKDADYTENQDKVMEIMIASDKQTDFAKTEDVAEELSKSIGLAAILNADEAGFKTAVKRYGTVLDLDTTKFDKDTKLAAAMSACAKSVFAEYGLKQTAKAKEAFYFIEAVGAVNTASRGKLIETIEAYKSVFEIDTTQLSVSMQQTIAGNMCVADSSKAYKNVAEIKSAYQSAKASASDTKVTPGGGGGGGRGSSGGGFSGGVIEVAPTETTEPEKVEIFSDLGDVLWAKNYIESLAKNGIISGKGEKIFDPNAPVLREEFIKMLVLAINLPNAESEAAFTDMESGAWYTPYISSASEGGLLRGYDDGRIGIGLSISREEAAVLLARAAEKAKMEIEPSESLDYTDASEISEFAIDAVKTCLSAELMQGNEQKQFLPKASITRAECAKVIFCLMDLL